MYLHVTLLFREITLLVEDWIIKDQMDFKKASFLSLPSKKVLIFSFCKLMIQILLLTGLLIFRGKKSKISRDFQGQIRGKIGRFRGRRVKIRWKIVRFRRILAEKSQISKDFQGQILRKIGRFHGKFRRAGETSPRNNQ